MYIGPDGSKGTEKGRYREEKKKIGARRAYKGRKGRRRERGILRDRKEDRKKYIKKDGR